MINSMIHGVSYSGGVQLGGDLVGTTSAPQVATVGGKNAADIATAVTNALQKFSASSAGVVGAISVNANPGRVKDTPFRPSLTRPTLCIYGIDYASGGISTEFIDLLCDENNPPVNSWGRVGGGSSTAAVIIVDGLLICFARPGDYVELKSDVVAGGGALTIETQIEVTL